MGTDEKKRKPRKPRPKSKPSITSANKPVVDALRDMLQGNKIWICNNDTIEVNRKPLEGFVCTPGEGVSAEEHIQVLHSAITNMLAGTEEARQVMEAIFVDGDEDTEKAHYIYPNISDRNMWRDITYFDMPSGFIDRLCKMYRIEKKLAATWVMEYMKFMYIKALHPMSVPSDTIGKVQRLHLQYTSSYGNLCGILENRIAYEPLDEANSTERNTEYARTSNRYYAEFGVTPPEYVWNGIERRVVERCVDLTRFWVIKKFWKR